MAKKNSRDKGNRGERAAAQEFKGWWGTEFARTPSSGGFATPQFRADWNAAGDLVTPDTEFPFCLECKWVEDWTMEQMLRNDGCLIFKWWQQTLGECPPDKLPLLVFKKNNQPFYCMINTEDVASVDFLHDQNIRYFVLPLTKNITGTHDMSVYILTLEDFFKLEPKIWREQKQRLISNKQMRASSQ
jgi:hypothetical protein